ncbi:hypothetical protein TYRP_000529 [Tyrophagus putrescentiae]|nr:hypothetical protein TYRP_000529 [Tyrophagus putrescentiae]
MSVFCPNRRISNKNALSTLKYMLQAQSVKVLYDATVASNPRFGSFWRWDSCTVGCATTLTTTPKKCHHQDSYDDDDVTSADRSDCPRTRLAFAVSIAVSSCPRSCTIWGCPSLSPMRLP